MSRSFVGRVLITVASAILVGSALQGQSPSTPATAAAQSAPKDLRPLLQPRQSEMRLVTTRYTLDRAAISGNFLGGGRAGFGRGPDPAAPPAVPLSPTRTARLERFDLDWRAALASIDPVTLSPAGRLELETLKGTVESDLKQLDADSAVLAQVSPLVPFAPAIVQLVEARIRMEEIDAEKAAGTLTEVTRQVARVRARLEAGLASGASPDALRTGGAAAERGRAAADVLRSSLAEWFAFYNGYDPLFTWWNGMPFKKAD